MNGAAHYRAAEEALEKSRQTQNSGEARMWLLNAQVHAQLAYTSALIGLGDEEDDRQWREVFDRLFGQVAEDPGLIPPDTCGSWIEGRRCILRAGHDEPCLPYRVPAGVPAHRPDALDGVVPRCGKCGLFPVDHEAGECLYPGGELQRDAARAAAADPASQAGGDLGVIP